MTQLIGLLSIFHDESHDAMIIKKWMVKLYKMVTKIIIVNHVNGSYMKKKEEEEEDADLCKICQRIMSLSYKQLTSYQAR